MSHISSSLSQLIKSSLVAKYFISPIPKTLSQSMAIYYYFAQLSDNPLVQYYHNRDIGTGLKLKKIEMVFNDPIDKYYVEQSSLEGSGQDPIKLDEFLEKWRKTRLSIKQASFPSRLSQFASKLRDYNQTPSEKELTPELCKEFWESTSSYYVPQEPVRLDGKLLTASYIHLSQPEQDDTTTTVEDTRHRKISVSPLENALIQTKQIVLNSETNEVVPLHEVLYDRFTEDNGRLIFEYANQANHHIFFDSKRYIHYNLDLILMTREPIAVTADASYKTFKDNKILPPGKFSDKSQTREKKFEAQLKSLERLRTEVLKGYQAEHALTSKKS